MADPLTPEALAVIIRQAYGTAVAEALGTEPPTMEDAADITGILGIPVLAGGWLAAARAAMDRLAPAHAALTGQLAVMTAARDDLARELDKALAELATADLHRDSLVRQLDEAAEKLFPRLRAERNGMRERAERAEDELTELREGMAGWPSCPDGCGCRLATTDPEAKECGCDGPCTMECRENGYPDAPSYRDLAVKHVMDERDHAVRELRLERDAHRLRADHYEGLWRAEHGLPPDDPADAELMAQLAMDMEAISALTGERDKLAAGSEVFARCLKDAEAERDRYRGGLEDIEARNLGDGTDALTAREALEGGHA